MEDVAKCGGEEAVRLRIIRDFLMSELYLVIINLQHKNWVNMGLGIRYYDKNFTD